MTIAPDPLPSGPLSLQAALTLALNYCNGGWLAMSDHVSARILAHDPGNAQALVVRGISAYKGLDVPRAEAALKRAVAIHPSFADGLLHLGLALLGGGRTAEAGAPLARALRLRPDSAEAMAGLAEVRLDAGDRDGAFALLRDSVAMKSNYSPSYIAYARLCFDRSMPPGAPAPARRPRAADRPRLTMASLGSYGRLTHTILEYLAVRLYADAYGMSFETPDWIGHRFFELDDPEMDPDVRPAYAEWRRVREEFAAGFEAPTDTPLRDRDLFLGGAPVDPLRRPYRDTILSWLRVRPAWRPYLDPVVDGLRAQGNTLVAVHIRQTDWWDRAYTPLSLYQDWLAAHWAELDRPVLVVVTDEPTVLEAFAAYRPVTSDRFAVRWDGLEYLQDFHVLTQADIVATSTGGFARTAAALNRRARLFLRPDAGNAALEAYDPWS